MIEEMKDIYRFWKEFQGNEREFNAKLLDMVVSGELHNEIFLEYLAVTQAEVDDCLEEAFGSD